MARRKVKLAYIENGSVRRATYRKRRQGLLKKAGELATLCDVRTCVVLHGEGEVRPEAWPCEDEATDMLHRLNDMPLPDQRNKMLNQEAFVQQHVTKQNHKLRRMVLNNQERQMITLIHEATEGRSLHDLCIDDAVAFSHFLKAKITVLHAARPMTTSTSSEPVKVDLPAEQQITEWAPIGHIAPLAEEVPAYHNTQMFVGSSSSGGGGLEEMTQPYMNNVVDSTWMPFYYDPWPQWPEAHEDIN